MSATSDEVTPLLVRNLTAADIPSIMEIERTSFSTPWRETTFLGLLKRSDSDLVGITRFARLVGYAVAWTVGDQAELGNVAVAHDERRKGVAQRLVGVVLDRLRDRGARECFLEVRESNETARRLYERCGFQVVGRRRNYYMKPAEDALVMRCDLI
jgi:[ribosomal protein S18]-alanine N-acetyltransferase